MFDSVFLRNSSQAIEGPLLVSKLLKIPVLLDAEEMEDLLSSPFEIYFVQGICLKGEGRISKQFFLEVYREYISALKEGKVVCHSAVKALFSSIFTKSSDILYAIEVEEGKQIIKATKPVIQLQMNHLHYSEEGEFRAMAYGKDNISWGVQFSYPQIYQDPKTYEVFQVKEEFPNTALFKELQKWIRANTVATPFVIGGKRKNAPIRIGRRCLSWISAHPQLKERHIEVWN